LDVEDACGHVVAKKHDMTIFIQGRRKTEKRREH
jgi:hypothetical protein